MNAINLFSKLSSAELGLIIRWVRSDFPSLSRVCRLFHTASNQEAQRFYATIESIYGAPYLRRAIEAIGFGSKSYVGKIDGLFSKAVRQMGMLSEARIPIHYSDDSSLDALNRFMLPWQEADALFKLWNVLRKTGHTRLKTLMSQVKLGSNYSKNIETFRAFFEANRLELKQVTHLDLSRCELRALPLELWKSFSGLRKLDLSGNSLESLPKEIGALSELDDLRLNHNRLTLLPQEIGNLHALKNFQCAFNALESVPDTIFKLRNLTTLNLCRNHLRQLPENLGDLQNLNYLYLEYNHLEMLPSSIGTIPYLLGIYLTGNKLEMLPESVCSLQSLKYLAIQSNAIAALPENIGNMASLHSLCMDNNEIRKLPESIVSLRELKHLSFSNNSISGFPKAMANLKKLDLFCFEINSIKYFPDAMEALPFWSLNPQYYPHLSKGDLRMTLNGTLTRDDFESVYWALGDKKWEECIDGVHHPHGEDVYDKGLHGKVKEPGFLPSMKKAFEFLARRYNHIIDKDFYLDLHTIACGHFDGKKTNTLMGQEKVGKFRDANDCVMASFKEPDYPISKGAIEEFNDLNNHISLIFGASFRLGDFVLKSQSPREIVLNYATLSNEQVSILFNFFLTGFYYEMGHAATDEARVIAIAKLVQRLEWLHPVRDGCGRTDTAILNYLLTCYGYNPVLLKFPYVSSCMTLKEWVAAVFEGMKAWRAEVGIE